jgi:uncharacterized repeat protein (TIGR03847 family)
MAHYEDDIYPVTRITAGAIGEPGRRVFILQAALEGQTISWIIEKEQAVALGKVIPRLLADVRADYPELSDPLVATKPNLTLAEPLEPVFRVSSIALGYDRLHDLVVLTLVDGDDDDALDDELEVEVEDEVEDEIDGAPDLRIFATRGQALLLSQQAETVVAAGRPSCPICGEPMDDFGHFCLPRTARWKWNSDYLQ